MTEPRVVERFKKRTIWFHWIHTAAFLTLIVTGAILFFPGLGAPAAGGITSNILLYKPQNDTALCEGNPDLG